MPEPIKCPACGGELRRDTRSAEYNHRNRVQMVDQPGLYCDACGEALLEPPDLAATREALRQLSATLSELEYAAALKRIDQLMDVPPGTPKNDELEHLVTAVEAYEAEHYPIGSPQKTQALRQLIDISERSSQNDYLSLDEAFDDGANDKILKTPNTETRAALAESEAVEQLERLNSIKELLDDDVAPEGHE